VRSNEDAAGPKSDEPLLFEIGSEGRTAVSLAEEETAEEKLSESLPASMIRGPIEDFPELSQPELVRHYTRLSQWNYGVDTGFYPLGSCTMKYNPKVNEESAALPGFARAHPHQLEGLSQGALALLHRLQGYLAEITGMDCVTLQPAAGAHAELTAMMMIRAYFEERGEKRTKVIIPDTAHGTNPASVSMCGFTAVPVKSGPRGLLETGDVQALMDEEVAAIMITNPNTLGIFECNVGEIAEIVHGKGGLVYVDGANLNALMGIVRFGDIGCDLTHMNLHKTFSTPHGGGGPGSGPLAVKEKLKPFLPVPMVEKEGGTYTLNYDLPKSVGRVRDFYGNFLICVRAYAYILAMGGAGLNRASVVAVVNANYIRSGLLKHYHLPYETPSMHECVFNDRIQQKSGVTTLDVAKRLIDYGFHPPTIYFPLVVDGALMIETTETESRQTLDQFVEAMEAIAEEAKNSPEVLKRAPTRSRITRVDEVAAARKPVLRWNPSSA
jgi:glycine dehydrogenase subunit 2